MPDLISQASQPIEELKKINTPDLLKRYRTRVEGAKQWREDEGIDDTWERLRDLYRLKHFSKESNEDRIAVGITFATVNVIAPAVAINHPKFIAWVADEDPDSQAKATIAEGVMTYWWSHHDMQKPWRRIVKDFIVYGLGWGKTTWRYEEVEVDRAAEDIDAEHAEAIAQADQYAVENPQMAPDLPTNDEIAGLVPTTEPEATRDHPVLERISPRDIHLDPEATCLADATWIAQRVTRPLEDVKNDERYDKKIRSKLTADKMTTWTERGGAGQTKDESERVELWEFYDLQRETVCVFSNSGDKFLLAPEQVDYPFGHPFVPLMNYEVPDQFYPVGDIEGIEPLQRELDQTRTQMSQARKLDIPKYLYRKSAFGQNGIAALRSDLPYTAVPIEDDTPFADVLAPMPRNEASPQLYQHSDVIENDIDLVSGVSEYQRGAAPETRRTATEASIIQDASNARAADKLAAVEAALGEIGGNLIALAQMYMTGDQAARIVADDGAAVYWSFTAEDIQGEFDFSIEAGSTQPRNETYRKQQAVELMNALSPFLGTGQLNDAAVILHVMKEGFGVSKPEKFLGPMAGMMGQMPQGMDPNAPMGPPGQDQENPQEEGAPSEEPDPNLARTQLAGQVGMPPPPTGP